MRVRTRFCVAHARGNRITIYGVVTAFDAGGTASKFCTEPSCAEPCVVVTLGWLPRIMSVPVFQCEFAAKHERVARCVQ